MRRLTTMSVLVAAAALSGCSTSPRRAYGEVEGMIEDVEGDPELPSGALRAAALWIAPSRVEAGVLEYCRLRQLRLGQPHLLQLHFEGRVSEQRDLSGALSRQRLRQ